jgi:hypothetical protein
MANCTATTGMTANEALTPTVFCENLIANCTGLDASYTGQTMCETTYGNRSAAQKNCQSYHLCWGVEGKTNAAGANPTVHCPHSTGAAPCN